MRIRQTGLLEWDEARATGGLTLFATIADNTVRLIGLDGEDVHTWTLPEPSTGLARLLPGGRLLTAQVHPDAPIKIGGPGGFIREYDWDGNLIWEHVDIAQHHDVQRLGNGNTLYLGWQPLSDEKAARVVGGIAGTEMPGGLIYYDFLREVNPAGEVVWEWHGSDLNIEDYPLAEVSKRAEFGHANACFPSDEGVLISCRVFNSVLFIDRETRQVKWERRDDSWGGQHDCQFLDNGNVMLFANGYNRPGLPHSRIVEFDPHTGEEAWVYKGDPLMTFFSPHISGVQRMPGGNTLICEGAFGRIFEVTPEGDIVWEYINPRHIDRDGLRHNWVFRAYRYSVDGPELAGFAS